MTFWFWNGLTRGATDQGDDHGTYENDVVCSSRLASNGWPVNVQLIEKSALPLSTIARELVGADHGGIGVCIIFVDAAPGEGPSLHTHPYEEIFITLEGEATIVANDQKLCAGPGDIIIVPPHTPHGFTNTGSAPLRQIDIHVSPTFSTEWL